VWVQTGEVMTAHSWSSRSCQFRFCFVREMLSDPPSFLFVFLGVLDGYLIASVKAGFFDWLIVLFVRFLVSRVRCSMLRSERAAF